MRVLIVDDDRATVDVIRDTVCWDSLDVYDVFTAYNIKEAKKILMAEQIDIVISDIEMPQMDGHRLTKLIKSDEVLKKIPVFLFSSLIDETMKRKGISVGADEQFSKPQIASLVQAIIKRVS